jgi:hypothetical protein
MHAKYWFENPKGRGHLGDLGINGRILLRKHNPLSEADSRSDTQNFPSFMEH